MRLNKKSFWKSLYKISVVLFLIGYNFAPSVLAIEQLSNIDKETPDQSVLVTTEEDSDVLNEVPIDEDVPTDEVPVDDSEDILPEGISDPEQIAKGVEVISNVMSRGSMARAARGAGAYSISSTSGIWTAVSGGSNVTGKNTEEIRWGTAAGNTARSGMRFNGETETQNFDPDQTFLIGDLTHFNWPTVAGTAANGATLKVTLNFSTPLLSPSPTFTYNFNIKETPNTDRLRDCVGYNTDEQISTTPCDDVITFPTAYGDKVFEIDNVKYTLVIDGFQSELTGGSTVSKFVTTEKADNTAYLFGHLSSILVGEPAISITKKVNTDDANTPTGPIVGVGDTVTFTYHVQNSGNVKLTNINVMDDDLGAVTCPQTELAAGKAMDCTAKTATATVGQYKNTATVTGTTPIGSSVTAEDPAHYFGVEKINICHYESKNTYTTVNIKQTADADGHDVHSNDIIPSYGNQGEPNFYGGKNWDVYGQSIYNNGCVIPQGKLTVKKVVTPSDGTEFAITGSGTPTVSGAPTFLNGNTGNISGTKTVTFEVSPGTYSVTETVPDGWKQVSNTCSGIVIAKGENKECTITNTKLATLTISKTTLPTGSDQEFGFTSDITGSENFTLEGGESKVFTLDAGTYSVSESDVSGWKNTNTVCSDGSLISAIELLPGEEVTCTFTNTKYGKISGYKYNDKDGSDDTTNDRTPVSGWTIFIDKDGDGQFDEGEPSAITNFAGYYEFVNLLPGNYDIYESMQVGWIVLIGGKKTITLSAGGNIENVNFVNVKQGSVTVNKNVDKDGDGDIDITGSTDWTWTLNNDTGHATGSTVSSLNPGTYTIKEVNQDNYHFKTLVCTGGSAVGIVGDTATINLKSGEDVVCTYTNARNLGTLIVKKIVTNDNGGTLNPDDFNFTIDGGNSIRFESDGDNTFTKYAGLSYNIVEVEANQRGYTTTYNDCTNVVVPHGGTATCTITNNDNTASLQLVKEVVNNNGGTANPTDWTLSANGPTPITGVSGVTSGTDFEVGTYTLSESAGPAGYSPSKWSCTNNIAVNENNQITLVLGQSTVCTIINDDIAPSLTLVKEVENTHGGSADATDWTLTATGTLLEPTNLSGEGGATSTTNFKADTYTLSESGDVAGYNAGDWSCDNATVDEGNQITLGLDQSTTCTITNTEIQPTLTLVKTVDNHYGGNKGIADFKLYIGNTEVTSGIAKAVNSNTEYTVKEDQLPGYTASVWGGDCSADGKITLTSGQNATCTITNSDIAPTLKIVKEAINDNGGTATIADFGITLTDTPLSFGEGSTENKVTTYEANPTVVSNKAYTLAETGATGYTQESLVCLDGNTNVGSTFTLNPGQNVVCTIVNDDIAPKLTLNKKVSNTQGGNKLESAWTLYAKQGDVTTLSGAGAAGENDVVSGDTFQAGTYTLSEEGPGGYTASAWSCEGTGSLSGSNITLGVGQEAVCSITNSDNAAGLTVVKNVVNDNGGNATVGEFEIKLNGDALSFGGGAVDGSTTTYTSIPSVESNTEYILSEIDHEGYIEGTWSCEDNSTEAKITQPFTLNEGQGITCTITNDDIAPKLTLTKVITETNGGTAQSDDFSLTVGGTGVSSGIAKEYMANTPYTINESALTGYEFVSITGDDKCPGVLGGTITLDEGDDITCTITNKDLPAQLTVIKKVVNTGNDGTKSASDFTMNVEGTDVSEESFSGSETGVTVTLDQGDFEVTEVEDTVNYTATYEGCTGSINVGETKTCTITNTGIDHKPTIEVTKDADKTSVEETGENVTFTFTVTNTSKVDTVEITSLTDSVFMTLAGDEDCKVGTVLAAGGTCQFSITKWIEGDYSGPDHYNKFTAIVEDEEGNQTDDDDDQTIDFSNVTPSIEVTKTPSVSIVAETGENVTFTFTVENTSNKESVTITSLADSVFGDLDGEHNCAVGTVLASGATCEFDITRWIEGDFSGSDHVNVFTAKAEDNDNTEVEDTDDATVDFSNVEPSIEVTKTPSVSIVAETGENVTFTFTVKNTSGKESVTITSLTDSIFGTLDGDADCKVGTVLASGATCEFSITKWIEGDYSGSSHVNVFTAKAKDNDNTEVEDTDDATVDFSNVTPSIEVTKTAGVTEVPETGENVTFTFTVKNTSSKESVTITSLTDSVFGTLDGDADCKVGTVLTAGATCDFSITEFIEGDYSGSDHYNVFTAKAKDNDDTEVEDTDDATVDFSNVEPSIEVTKTPSVSIVPETGENVTFSFTVKNTSGKESVTITSLTDSIFGTLDGDADCKVGTVLTAGATCDFSITEFIEGDYSGSDHYNVFTAKAEDNDETEVEDTDDATVDFSDVLPDITVSKVASIHEIPETGGKVTFTFTVINNSTEKGTITVLEDNKFGTLVGDADCNVGTVLAGGATCTFEAEFDIPANTPGDPEAPTTHTNTFTATVEDDDGNEDTDDDDETIELTAVPSLKLVKKVVHKYNSDRSITANDWFLYASGDEGFIYPGDTNEFKFVKAGAEYSLYEKTEEGKEEYMSQFEAGEWICNGGELNGSTLTLSADDDVTCTITNTAKPATIIVSKDVRSGEKDIYSEDIFGVYLAGERIAKRGEIRDSEENPLVAEFTLLSAGKYSLKEINIPDGYISQGCYPIYAVNLLYDVSSQSIEQNGTNGKYYVGNGETLEFVCTNDVIEPLLQIEKSNDKQYIDQYAGDEVTYTITVTAPSDDEDGTYILKNVKVSDIAPAGFAYLSGTWTAQKNGSDITVTEPTYDGTNPATWEIGDMVEGDVVVLTYRTKISLLQEPGKYPDIAWVGGDSLSGESVLGVSSTDDTTPFVGTDVTVIEPIETEEGEVLGASITLPATGASTYLTLGALLMMILGTLTLLFKPFKKFKYLFLAGLMAISFITLTTPNRVLAANDDIKVSIMQPASPTNKTSFNIGFVALDLKNNPIIVECYKDSETTPFATFPASTGNCPAKVSASGTYTFYVKALSTSGEQTSTPVVVEVNLGKPSPVINYSKTGNVLKFKTANDGKTEMVEIFRSEKSSFTANASTRIHIEPVSPDTEHSWTDTTAQTGKTYYYALRAVDAQGNVSSIVSDPLVVTIPATPTPVVTGTETDDGTTTPPSTEGEVEGETSTEGEVAGETDVEVGEGAVEGEEDEKEGEEEVKEGAKSFLEKWYIWLPIILVIGGIIFYVRKQKQD